MSEGTTNTTNVVGGNNEARVQSVDNLKTNFRINGIEYGLTTEREMVSASGETGTTGTDGAAAKGGNDLVMVTGAEATRSFAETQLNLANVQIKAEDGNNPNKDKEEPTEEKENTTR